MPPTQVHFNGGVNLADTETVMRELATRVPVGVRRIPDGETGDRQNWIFYQLQRFWQTPGLEQADSGDPEEGYQALPKVRLADGTTAEDIDWPDLGYAAVYQDSYATFVRLRDEGVIPAGVRFQAQYPTPLASISGWIVPEEQALLEPSYERALFADLDTLLAAVPHEDLAVQWDVAVEFGILDGGAFGQNEGQDFEGIVARLVRCIDQVPADVPAGLHLCYGDYQHQHFIQPESLATQVRMSNAVVAGAGRSVSWLSFTVPQNRSDAEYFAPLADLEVPPDTELYLALVPYHPEDQEPGTTAEQISIVDELLGSREWGICTECGMARAQQEEISGLLDQHRSILAG